MRYHGNYCGPNWSAGKHQPSVDSTEPAIDEFDQTCKEHDAAYANGEDLKMADYKFASNNISLNPKRLAAAIAVGAQGYFRPNNNQDTMSGKRNMRGIPTRLLNDPAVPSMRGPLTNAAIAARKLPPLKQRGANTAQTVIANVATGSKLRTAKPKVSLTSDTARIRGHDLLATVDGPASATGPELGVLFPINPCYLQSTSIAMYTPYYDEYRIISATVHFHTKMPTSTSGEVWMASTSNPQSNVYNTQDAAFVAKLMSTQNAVMGPIWSSLSLSLKLDSGYKKVNPLTDAAPSDSTYGDFLIYVQSGVTGGTVGYAMIDYDIEFRKRRFTSAAAMLAQLGPTLSVNISEATAHTVGGAVAVGIPMPGTTGTVYQVVYDSSTAFPSQWATQLFGSSISNVSVKPGAKLYFLLYNPSFARVYTNYSAAITASNEFLVWNDTAALVTNIPFQVTCVFTSIANTLNAV